MSILPITQAIRDLLEENIDMEVGQVVAALRKLKYTEDTKRMKQRIHAERHSMKTKPKATEVEEGPHPLPAAAQKTEPPVQAEVLPLKPITDPVELNTLTAVLVTAAEVAKFCSNAPGGLETVKNVLAGVEKYGGLEAFKKYVELYESLAK